MPVSHLGFPVSDIASATSFYLSALQPLGYRYVGQQGDSVGLGVNDADFFLCQTKNGYAIYVATRFQTNAYRTRPSPTHIAFTATSRLTVRECYAAALNAGGRPSGAPGYRNNDCSCFNAAAEDFDGNTIEFIFREPCESAVEERTTAPTESGMTRATPKEGARNAYRDDVKSLTSYVSKMQSTAQTALDFASSAARSYQEHKSPTPGMSRSKTEPIGLINQNGGKAIMGTLLGAAAGAAVTYAMTRSERDNAREEAAFTSSTRPQDSRTRDSQEKSVGTRISRRDYDTSKYSTAQGSRPPPRTKTAIEAAPYDDRGIQDVLSRYKSSARPALERSKTYDAIEYAPKTSSAGRGDSFSMKRASTMPLHIEDRHADARTSKSASRHYSRRGSVDSSNLKRHDSGVSMDSRRSRRSSLGKTSTIKPPRRRSWSDSAANVPLPSSKATSHTTRGERTPRMSKAPSYISGAQVPLPQSKATSYASRGQAPVPLFPPKNGYMDAAEESDGLGDMVSVVPDDSISCVDFSKRKKGRSSRNGSSHTSKRSEADSERTVRPTKSTGSRHTLPTRRKDDNHNNRRSKRSTATYA